MILYVATGNHGKLREFAEGRSPGMHIHACPCYAQLPECVESGTTFEANAALKAEYYSRHTFGLVIADDSGLEVDALGGAPGVYSARYSGPGATDASNIAKLLDAIRDVPLAQRTARYVGVISLAHEGREMQSFRGTAEGVIIPDARGTGGFGYDPYFYFPSLGKTFAELSPDEKWIHSHRGKAFRQMLSWLP